MRALVQRLRRNDEGLAFVEFAFVAPILLFLILVGLELVNYALAHLRVNQIAMTVADNSGRVVQGIDEANVYEVFAGADVIGAPMNFQEHGRIVLSSLQDNGKSGSNAGQMINWQRCWGALDVAPAYGNEDTGRENDDLAEGMGPAAGQRITSGPETAVMVVEVTYQYQPMLGYMGMPGNALIRHESAFNVRGRQNNDISNAQDLEELDECPTANPGGGGASGGSSTGGSSSGGSTGGANGGGGGSNGGGGANGGGNGGGSNGGGNGGSNGGGGRGGGRCWFCWNP